MSNKIYNNKKEIFSEIIDMLYSKKYDDMIDVRLSQMKTPNIIDEIKNVKIIEIDNLGDFISYVNYDHFLIFKFSDFYYFCETELVPYLGEFSLIKLIDFNLYLRKDKINKIEQIK